MAHEVEVRTTAVERYFFTPVYRGGPLAVLGWWEARRPIFNLCVGGAGLLSLATVATLLALPPAPVHFSIPLGVVLVYGVMANLCFTLGAPIDIALRRMLGSRAPAIGPVLFRYGFVFSVGLSLLPIPLAFMGWVLKLFS